MPGDFRQMLVNMPGRGNRYLVIGFKLPELISQFAEIPAGTAIPLGHEYLMVKLDSHDFWPLY